VINLILFITGPWNWDWKWTGLLIQHPDKSHQVRNMRPNTIRPQPNVRKTPTLLGRRKYFVGHQKVFAKFHRRTWHRSRLSISGQLLAIRRYERLHLSRICNRSRREHALVAYPRCNRITLFTVLRRKVASQELKGWDEFLTLLPPHLEENWDSLFEGLTQHLAALQGIWYSSFNQHIGLGYTTLMLILIYLVEGTLANMKRFA
jgi:hypothetical protein